MRDPRRRGNGPGGMERAVARDLQVVRQHELRDFLQSRTRRDLGGLCGRLTGLRLFGQELPASRELAAMTSLGYTVAPSRTHGPVQPALDKTENSITVLGPNVQ
jgi:hypothetical protein